MHSAVALVYSVLFAASGSENGCERWNTDSAYRVECDSQVELAKLDPEVRRLTLDIEGMLPAREASLPAWSMSTVHAAWLRFREQRCNMVGGLLNAAWTWQRAESSVCRLAMAKQRLESLTKFKGCLVSLPAPRVDCTLPPEL